MEPEETSNTQNSLVWEEFFENVQTYDQTQELTASKFCRLKSFKVNCAIPQSNSVAVPKESYRNCRSYRSKRQKPSLFFDEGALELLLVELSDDTDDDSEQSPLINTKN